MPCFCPVLYFRDTFYTYPCRLKMGNPEDFHPHALRQAINALPNMDKWAWTRKNGQLGQGEVCRGWVPGHELHFLKSPLTDKGPNTSVIFEDRLQAALSVLDDAGYPITTALPSALPPLISTAINLFYNFFELLLSLDSLCAGIDTWRNRLEPDQQQITLLHWAIR